MNRKLLEAVINASTCTHARSVDVPNDGEAVVVVNPLSGFVMNATRRAHVRGAMKGAIFENFAEKNVNYPRISVSFFR